MDQQAIEIALNILSARPECQDDAKALNIAAADLAVELWEEAGGGPDLRAVLDVLKSDHSPEMNIAARKRCRALDADAATHAMRHSGITERKLRVRSWAALAVRAALKPPGYAVGGPWREKLDACAVVCVRHILDLLEGELNLLNFPKAKEYPRMVRVTRLAEEMISLYPEVKDAAEKLAAISRGRQSEHWINAANRAYSEQRARADIGLIQHQVDAWIKSRDS